MVFFSTVLFVEGNPVGYNVKGTDRDRLSLNPAENPNREIVPPVIEAKKEAGLWRIEGTTDRDLIDQVLEDISMQLPDAVLSATP